MTKKKFEGFGSHIEFASFGKSVLAYVRPVHSDDIREQYPALDDVPAGLELFALYGADGEPIALADEAGSLVQSAVERDLLTVSLH